MAYKLNKKLSDLTPYDPIEGDYKVRLDANESFFNINKVISTKIADAIAKIELNRYPDPYAVSVVKAFADYYEINKEYVTAGNGSDELISIITSCFLETGDKLLTLTPDFSMYAFYGSLYELEVESFPKDDDLTINIDNLIDYCNNNNIKMLIFSNPCNPTSLGITSDEALKLVRSVKCLVVLDEAYMDFWNQSIIEHIGEFDNLIILKTCSKAIGMAAIRLGFAVAGTTITKALKAAKSPYNTDAISQTLGELVFLEKAILKTALSDIIEQRNLLYSSFKLLSERYKKLEFIYETKTNFLFIKTSFAKELFDLLLKESIAVRMFNGYLRITAGNANENIKLVDAMENALQQLN